MSAVFIIPMQNDICQHSAQFEDGIISCTWVKFVPQLVNIHHYRSYNNYGRFSRSLEGTSQGQDLDLNTDHYVFYGVGDTPQCKIANINDKLNCIWPYQYLLYTCTCIASKSGGFTFHEKTPAISASRINPTQDNSLTLELAMVSTAEMCPKFLVGWTCCMYVHSGHADTYIICNSMITTGMSDKM